MPRNGGRPVTREVGTILSITPAGHVTVRARSAEVVPEGTGVRDARGILHGRIVRVFGPVDRPYYSIRPRKVPTPAEGVALLESTLVRE